MTILTMWIVSRRKWAELVVARAKADREPEDPISWLGRALNVEDRSQYEVSEE
jgi:hypothetical protein